MSERPVNILLVEDNPGDADLLLAGLSGAEGFAFRVTLAEELDEAFRRLRKARLDVILLDLSLPDSQGLETFLQMHAQAPDIPILVLTGLSDEAMAVRTVHEGAQDYLVKGEVTGRSLVRAIRYAMERKRLLASEREKSEQLKLAVREAHHRIKNNLQAISDLLYLELASEAASSPAEALRESMERVQAIALVHDLLSQDEDVQTADARVVIERLVPMVLKSSSASPAAIAASIDVSSVRLSSKKITTLALIVNELVSNAVKHGCRDGRTSAIAVSLRQECEDLVLQVRDHGPGLPEGFDLDTDAHVGLDVVRVMAERDLDGRLTLTTDDGVRAEVRFPW
jgi:two-component sensor histidine kinase/CheY-like chemotaxis protein